MEDIRQSALTKDQREFISFMTDKCSDFMTRIDICRQGLSKSNRKAFHKPSTLQDIRAAHYPKAAADFLATFANPDGLKFLTHDFDPDSETDIISVADRFESIYSNRNNTHIPESLYKLIAGFIRGPKWIDRNDNPHFIFLKSHKIKTWLTQNPGLHPIISNEFGQEIQDFRNTVRVSKPELSRIVQRLLKTNNQLAKLRATTNDLDKADFYTNVNVLANKILRKVLIDIAQRNPESEIQISFSRASSPTTRHRMQIIKIVHIGSEANSLEDVVRKISFEEQSGEMFNLLKSCKGYCDWTIEARFEKEGCKRWRILDSENLPETETMPDNSVGGFTHIFTFYK